MCDEVQKAAAGRPDWTVRTIREPKMTATRMPRSAAR